jgi:Kef-type K+ transport system membrane component KefB
MTLSSSEVAHLLLALTVLLAAAHAAGQLFVLLRQPRVIGEIVGGLAVGPTLLGLLAPELQHQLLPTDGATGPILGACSQLGLVLRMFCSGAEMRSMFKRGEERTVTAVTLTGVALPFAAGVLLFSVFDPSGLIGPADNRTALLLVFALAIAVTSIPVIARIMVDLGVLDTSFARIVLGVAVIEDTVVYVVLAIALGLAAAGGGDDVVGLPALLALQPGGGPALVYHVAATLTVSALLLTAGARAFRWTLRQRFNVLHRSNPAAYQLVFLFSATLLCVAVGVTPMFGAFLGGIAASRARGPRAVAARASIKEFSFAFFIPIYFAIVGLRLDLVRHFDVTFFCWFLAFACIAKSLSVYLGARVAGEGRHGATNLAVAMNARGGPGIVLASVAYEARIINGEFYASLVMLAVVTSLLAGSWLGHVVRTGRPLRPDPAGSPVESTHQPVPASPDGPPHVGATATRPPLAG